MSEGQTSFFARCSPLLFVSIGINIVLAGGGVFFAGLALRGQIGSDQVLETQAALPAPPQPVEEPKPFRWGQLESADYKVYIANLRGIGCPEQTLRDIITADVGSLYKAKRRELHLGNDPARRGRWSSEEEEQVILALLGPAPAEPEETPAVENWEVAANTEIAVPLALQNIDTNTPGLAAEQQNIIENLRRRFINAVGGTNQDPNDPQYAERWRKAQPEMDARLKAMLGHETYRQLQRQARLSSVSQ